MLCGRRRSTHRSYLESIPSKADGTGGPRQFLFVASFENLFQIQELEKKISEHLDGELTADEAELVRLFRKGVQKRREGKDAPFNAWNEW